MIPQKMSSLLLLMMFSLSDSRLIHPVPDDDGVVVSPSFFDRDLLEELDGKESGWTEDEMKLYMKGVEDNTTVVTFSAKVYYTLEVGEQTGGKIVDMVDALIDVTNKKLEELGALTKIKLHCLEQTSARELVDTTNDASDVEYYRNGDKNSADVVLYIGPNLAPGLCAKGVIGPGIRETYKEFGHLMISWYNLGYCIWAFGLGDGENILHEVGHNLGLVHEEMEDKAYYGRVYKTFRFALAAIGDESEACPKQEADWEFRSRCFKSLGKYTGDELEIEASNDANKDAKACQAQCADTRDCSFFAFREDRTCQHVKSKEEWKDYAGNASVTKSGRECQAWSSSFPHNSYFKEVGDHNYCRNPDGMEGGPWCYTTDPNERWEYCFCSKDCTFYGANAVFSRATRNEVKNNRNLITGPATCPDGCLKSKGKFTGDKLHNKITAPGQTAEECQAHCADTQGCSVFSFKEVQPPVDCGWGVDTATGESYKKKDDCSFCAWGCGGTSFWCRGDCEWKDYKGSINVTKSGRECKVWKDTKWPYIGGAIVKHNYCRNPTKYAGGPWCYTTDPDKDWELCDVPEDPSWPQVPFCGLKDKPTVDCGYNRERQEDCSLCAPPASSHPSVYCQGDCEWKDYKGNINVTKSGRECKAWKDTKWSKVSGLMGYGDHNYCRNPDNEPGPWCYTTDPDKKWELCDVPEDPSWPQVPFCGLKDEANACELFGANAAYQTEVEEEEEGEHFVNGPATCPVKTEQPKGVCHKMEEGMEGWMNWFDSYCCTTGFPCGLNEGHCKSDEECEGSLMCGSKNCQVGDFFTFSPEDNCCTDKCIKGMSCFDTDLDPKGAKYDGCAHTTVSGRTCQAWASTTPHNHRFTDQLGNDSNNCRNPDGESGPWCYTTDPDERWELCPDLTCPKGGLE